MVCGFFAPVASNRCNPQETLDDSPPGFLVYILFTSFPAVVCCECRPCWTFNFDSLSHENI